MARVARVVAVGYPHHITQRGNNRQEVFLDDDDRNKYLSLISQYSQKHNLTLISYCLMPNHVHFIGIPGEKDSLAKTFDFAHMRYAQYFNKKIGASGHLWQGRFYSCILDEPHLLTAACYIDRNPVRARMVKQAWDWRWSSARYHIGREKRSLVAKGNLFDYIDITEKEWMDCLKTDDDEKSINELRKYTKTGLPLGAEQFIQKLEVKIGKVLRAIPRGRPRHKRSK